MEPHDQTAPRRLPTRRDILFLVLGAALLGTVVRLEWQLNEVGRRLETLSQQVAETKDGVATVHGELDDIQQTLDDLQGDLEDSGVDDPSDNSHAGA